MASKKQAATETTELEQPPTQTPEDMAQLPTTEPTAAVLPSAEELAAQVQELAEANALHKLFGGFLEQTTRALANGNTERAAAWLEQGLTIVRSYADGVGKLATTTARLEAGVQAMAQTYEQVIGVLQSRASVPPDDSWREGFARIMALEEAFAKLLPDKNEIGAVSDLQNRIQALETASSTIDAVGKELLSSIADEGKRIQDYVDGKLNVVPKLQSDLQAEIENLHANHLKQIYAENAAHKKRIAELEGIESRILEAVDTRVKNLFRAAKINTEEVSYDAR